MSIRAALGRWLIRLASAASLALLLAGAPYLLITQIGSPLPRSLPTTTADLERILTTPVTDQVAINLLAAVMWILWATFTASVIAEIPARLRGVHARRLPLVAPIQTIASWLLSGLTAGVIAAATITPIPIDTDTPPAAAVHATLNLAAQSATTPDAPADTETTGRQPSGPEHQAPVVCAGEHILVIDGTRYAYVVQRDDSLWAIAKLCLDNGQRWPEIWELNKGRHFPNVGGSLHQPDLIYPGWDLHLPAGAAPPPGATTIEPSQPTRPDPSPPPTTVPPGATATPDRPAPAATPTRPPPSTPTASPTGTPAPPAGHDETDHDSLSPEGGPLPITAVLATAGLLTALLLARLHHRRRRQLQHRRQGRRLPAPDPAAETTARIAAQPADVTRLDHGLRALATGLHGRDPDQLPDIVAAWLDTGTVHLLLAQPCPDPPAPYHTTADGTTWTLPADATLPDHAGQLAPLPALVTVASQPGGQHLLVDLERSGLLTITGDPDRTRELLRYLAVELATAQWIDDAEVVLVGFDPQETQQLITLGEERLHAASSLPDALARIGRRAAANTAALTNGGAGSSLAGRIDDIVADAWMPHLLLIADPTAELTDIATQLRSAGRCAVAIVAAATTPSTWNLHVDHTGHLSVDWLSITDAHAARLPADQLARLAPVMQAARTTLAAGTTQAPPDRQEIDEPVPPADDQPWAHGSDLHGHLLDLEATDRLPADPATPAGRSVPADIAAIDKPATGVPGRADQPGSGSQPDPEGSPAVHPATHPLDQSADPARTDTGSLPSRLQPSLAIPEPAALPPAPAPAAAASASGVRRRIPPDPDLDADLHAWYAPDPHRPRIAILGPVTINAPGRPPADRPRFHAEIIVYLATRGSRGATADQLDTALWPERQISQSARRVNMTKVRRWLGEDAGGHQWLPPNTGDQRLYRLADGYLLDWHLFRRLRARGESRGAAGAADLRHALELVRGAPLDGCDRPYQAGARNPYTWLPASGIQPHHLASAIVDTAHTLVNLYLDAADTAAARWAVDQAWLADPDRLEDHPWLDLMRITAAEGNTSELHSLINQLVQAREAEVPEDLNPNTYRQIDQLAGDLLNVG